MNTTASLSIRNGDVVALAEIPQASPEDFREQILQACEAGARIATLFGRPVGDKIQLFAALASDGEGQLALYSTAVSDAFPSLTPACAQAHLFEREIAEQWGVRPEGHPWLKPVRFHKSYRAGQDAWNRPAESPVLPGVTDFFSMAGDEIHEVAVGPVHAGIIEPGHFRFQCHGENVFHLEISLGYQHRGVERALLEDLTNEPFTTWKRWPAIQRLAMRWPIVKRWKPWRIAGCRRARRRSAPLPWNWSGWPTIPAIWACWPMTLAISRPPVIADAFAAIS